MESYLKKKQEQSTVHPISDPPVEETKGECLQEHKDSQTPEQEGSSPLKTSEMPPQNSDDPLLNISEETLIANKKLSAELKKKPQKKLGIIPEKEANKFKSYFQSPTLNRAFGEFMNMNLKTLRDEQTEISNVVQIKPFVMGICGGTSAGKSQIVKMISKSLNKRKNTDKVTFLSEENFFKSKSQHNQEEKDIDFDHPTNIDWEMFMAALNALMDRKKFEIPLFDMKSEIRKKETKLLEPSDLIIVEGRLVFYDEGIRSKCNLKIFLDTDEDVRLSRRIYKDVMTRKKKVEDVIDRYLKFVKPDFEKYVLPSKKYADIIIPNYGGGFSNEMPEDGGDHDEIGFSHFDHAAVGLIIDQVSKKVKKIKEMRTQTNEKVIEPVIEK